MTEPAISERAQHLLKMLIERYIRDGQPVGSKVLAEDTALSLSPATIRNIMADLEELGYLLSPHTSAGRVPTQQAYRFFVDSLITIKPMDKADLLQVKQQLDPQLNVQGLISTASNLLSDITKQTGLVMLPRVECLSLQHIEFMPLNGQRVLVILVLNDKEVQNRIIHTDRDYATHELQQASNFLNSFFAGKEVREVRQNIIKAMQEDKENMDNLMQAAIAMAEQALNSIPEQEDYIVTGQSHLLDLADAASMQRLRSLFEAFTQKQQVLYLLDQCLNAEGIQIFIGGESGFDIFGDCSVVTSPYTVEGKVVGVLGVIGPTRMPYEKVIPVVDITAKLLGAALNQAR